MKVQRPFLTIIALILFVSLACSTIMGGESQPEAVEEPEAAAADPNPTPKTPPDVLPSATREQVTEAVPTDTPVPSPYFTEEFDSDPQWDLEVVKDETNAKQVDSDPESVTTKFANGRMIFNIPEEWLSAFYTYTGETYEDVRLDMEVENRGVSSQQVSLFCRDDGGDKSYEIEVSSNGKWVFKVNRRQVINGASAAIKIGKEINQYTLICKGDEVSFFFNGVEPKGSPFVDNQAVLGEGNVGFVVTSKRAIPVDVEIEWFKISEP